LGSAAWAVFGVTVPILLLVSVLFIGSNLPWVKNAFLSTFGNGDAALLAGLIAVGVSVDSYTYTQLSNYRGTKLTVWTFVALGAGIIFFVLFGAGKVFGLYALSDETTLASASSSLYIFSAVTLVCLAAAVALGAILKVLQIDDVMTSGSSP
jgi:hypothetical protein